MTLKKNDIVNLTITSATAEGSGVGRTDDGIAVFVQGSAIGDELNVRILKVKKTYAFGKIEEILVPSKARITPDCVILDPPRKGCGEELVKTISRMSPSRVVYVSCDPATLARDLKFFTENGYTPKEITPCDMFSGTSHVESVALLTKVHK